MGGGAKDALIEVAWKFAISVLAVEVMVATAYYSLAPMQEESYVAALDAKTGSLKWHWDFPVWTKGVARGDYEGFFTRFWYIPERPICLPVCFSSPTVDAEGVVYIG